MAALEDSTHLLSAKVDDQYQTKVESASKYRLRLSGIVLMNLFSNRGVTDNQDVPNWATGASPSDPQGNFGATLRQSEIGLEAFGPSVAGARTSADLQLDFSGGFPQTYNGVNFGLVRLRIASLRLDWDHTSIVAGQDNLFHLAAVSHFFRFTFDSDLWLRWKSLGMDSASTRRASLRSGRWTDHYRAGRNRR